MKSRKENPVEAFYTVLRWLEGSTLITSADILATNAYTYVKTAGQSTNRSKTSFNKPKCSTTKGMITTDYFR